MNEMFENLLYKFCSNHVAVVLEVFPDGSFITEEWYD